jgi:hypothetical protein
LHYIISIQGDEARQWKPQTKLERFKEKAKEKKNKPLPKDRAEPCPS